MPPASNSWFKVENAWISASSSVHKPRRKLMRLDLPSLARPVEECRLDQAKCQIEPWYSTTAMRDSCRNDGDTNCRLPFPRLPASQRVLRWHRYLLLVNLAAHKRGHASLLMSVTSNLGCWLVQCRDSFQLELARTAGFGTQMAMRLFGDSRSFFFAGGSDNLNGVFLPGCK